MNDIRPVRNTFRMDWTRSAWARFLACVVLSNLAIGASALASECNGKADALGVSRVIAVDPLEHSRVGTMQYPETLPLADHEVVLTFDDGPSPRYTDRILATLASAGVKAAFFMVGEMAKMFPEEARKVEAEGHTVGTHSFRHPLTFGRMSEAKADAEIDRGVQAVAMALGNPDEVAPFFRVPGLLTSKSTEAALASRKLMTWSADFTGHDWKGISSAEIEKRAISRIEDKGRGILLLHDIHEQTVAALPNILSELKQRGYKIVQVVPASATVAKTETTPEQWRLPLRHSPETEQGHEETAQLRMTTVTQTDAPHPPEAGTGKLALAEERDEKRKRFATIGHRCGQLLGCGPRGCSRRRGAQPNQGDKDAYFPKSSGDRLGCSRVHRNDLSRRLSAKELRHRRQRHGNQDRQHYAIQRTGIGLRSDREDRTCLL
jgi:peptidoglycan/xylan/chitin deacetylase (PgdA/CDA1 family)